MLCLLGVLPLEVAAADGMLVHVGEGQVIRLERHDDDVRIDAVLDEPVWQSLPYYDQFEVIEPDTLAPAPYSTRVRLFYSSRGLYVGVEMDQPADTLISRLSSRDQRQISRDGVSITLDTSGTGRYGYWFNLHLGGSISDGTVLPERQFSSDWDGPWRGATRVTATGWNAEFMIPWGTVAMPRADGARHMGFYISRAVAYEDQRWGWPALPSTKPQFMSALQPLELEGLAPRQQYNFYPYVSYTTDEVENDDELNIGADLFWRPSSNFQLNATLNPDFGGVEADSVDVNLTALETFFPEQRLFFLEGQEVFNATPRAETQRGGRIGQGAPPITMVNTRRIGGRAADPQFPEGFVVAQKDVVQPVDVMGAFKTTGQIGAFRYGVLGAMEGQARFNAIDPNGQDVRISNEGNDYEAMRLLWENNVGGQYRAFGLLSTAVIGGEGHDAYAQGADWHFYTQGARLKFDGQVFTSDVDDEGQGWGGFNDIEYSVRQGRVFRAGVEYMDGHVDLNDLGFLQRNSYWQARASHQRTDSNLGWARQNQLDARTFYRENLDGRRIGSGVLFTDELTLNSLRRLTATVNYFFKNYDDVNSFGNGTYRIEDKPRVDLNYNSNTAKAFSWGFGGGYQGEDLGGDTYTAQANVRWRPNDRFSTGLEVAYLNRDGWLLHDEDRYMTTFKADQWQPVADIEYFLNARQQLRMSLQWIGVKAEEDRYYLVPDNPGKLLPTTAPPGPSNDFSVSQVSFQVRYRWEIAPLSELFVVYTRISDDRQALDGRDFQDIFREGWYSPYLNSFVVKLRYRFGS